MNTNALFKISYGLFVLIAKENEFDNGCIINTFSQITNTPNRVAVVVNKTNKTADIAVLYMFLAIHKSPYYLAFSANFCNFLTICGNFTAF